MCFCSGCCLLIIICILCSHYQPTIMIFFWMLIVFVCLAVQDLPEIHYAIATKSVTVVFNYYQIDIFHAFKNTGYYTHAHTMSSTLITTQKIIRSQTNMYTLIHTNVPRCIFRVLFRQIYLLISGKRPHANTHETPKNSNIEVLCVQKSWSIKQEEEKTWDLVIAHSLHKKNGRFYQTDLWWLHDFFLFRHCSWWMLTDVSQVDLTFYAIHQNSITEDIGLSHRIQ